MQPDEERRDIAAKLTTQLLSRPATNGMIGHAATAQVQPMKPTEMWLRNIFTSLREHLGVDLSCASDTRMAPLASRWHCHTLVGAEAAMADEHGFHTDHMRFFVSWSFCFSAATGRPRMYFSIARNSLGADSWEFELIHCKIPARASVSWTSIAHEVVELLVAGQSLSSALCGASLLASLAVYGPEFRLQRCKLAPASTLDVIGRELFGASQESCLHTLQWLLVTTCPNPFAEKPRALSAVSSALESEL